MLWHIFIAWLCCAKEGIFMTWGYSPMHSRPQYGMNCFSKNPVSWVRLEPLPPRTVATTFRHNVPWRKSLGCCYPKYTALLCCISPYARWLTGTIWSYWDKCHFNLTSSMAGVGNLFWVRVGWDFQKQSERQHDKATCRSCKNRM